MRKIQLLILMLIGSPFNISAQAGFLQLITPCGNSISNSSFKLDYSIGEVAIITLSGNPNVNTQGFNQPNYNITTSINQIGELLLSVYPNPTSNQLFIGGIDKTEQVEWTVINVLGELLYTGNGTIVDAALLPTGMYTINILHNGNQKHITKFVKQ